MLSRVAEAIYWMSRYIERAENVARFIDANFQMILDLPGSEGEQWEPLVITTGDRELFFAHYDKPDRQSVIRFLTFDKRNPNSIISCLCAARKNARSVREYISSEMWQQINTFFLTVRDGDPEEAGEDLSQQFFVDIMTASHLFAGTADNTMSHGEGWHFCRLGRMLERADKTSRILDVKYYVLLPSVADVGTPFDNILWAALLRSTSAYEMYRKRHGRITPEKIVDFLLLDNKFPRAMHFCLVMAEISLRYITGTPRGHFSNGAEQALGRLLARFDYILVEEILTGGLHEFLDATQAQLNQVGEAIQEVFFSVKPVCTANNLWREE